MIPTIAQVVIGLPVEGPFDYLIPDELRDAVVPGQRVLVRFAGAKRVGFVTALLPSSAHAGRLSVLIRVLDERPVFSSDFLKLADLFAARFACTPGEALELFLPACLRKSRPFVGPQGGPVRGAAPLPEVLFDRGQAGRWDVLVPRIAQTLHQGLGVLVLVPDATYCPDVLPKLGPLVKADQRVLLARGTEKEEYARWQSVRSGKARLAVGFISAVFAPVRGLGLIVVLEEESPFYRHDRSPFYHAREVALMRSAIQGCAVVCVSSAPSVEMWHRAADGQAVLTCLPQDLAPVQFLDLTNFKMKKGTFVPSGLRNLMEPLLIKGEKVLLYIQAARGVSGVMEEVKKAFPQARVAGYDRSTSLLPEADVLVATQAVFRHRSTLKVALAVVLDIDWEFHKHDHQASHSAFALVQHLRQAAQVKVLLQTRHASDPLLHSVASGDAADFYGKELALRREMGLPPFRTFVTVIVRSSDPAAACAEAKRLYDMLIPSLSEEDLAFEPQEDRSPLVRGKFRYRFSVHGTDNAVVKRVTRGLRVFHPRRGTVVTISVD